MKLSGVGEGLVYGEMREENVILEHVGDFALEVAGGLGAVVEEVARDANLITTSKNIQESAAITKFTTK
jgi:hypothetical protein